jgi:hypothetical protein
MKTFKDLLVDNFFEPRWVLWFWIWLWILMVMRRRNQWSWSNAIIKFSTKCFVVIWVMSIMVLLVNIDQVFVLKQLLVRSLGVVSFWINISDCIWAIFALNLSWWRVLRQEFTEFCKHHLMRLLDCVFIKLLKWGTWWIGLRRFEASTRRFEGLYDKGLCVCVVLRWIWKLICLGIRTKFGCGWISEVGCCLCFWVADFPDKRSEGQWWMTR